MTEEDDVHERFGRYLVADEQTRHEMMAALDDEIARRMSLLRLQTRARRLRLSMAMMLASSVIGLLTSQVFKDGHLIHGTAGVIGFGVLFWTALGLWREF